MLDDFVVVFHACMWCYFEGRAEIQGIHDMTSNSENTDNSFIFMNRIVTCEKVEKKLCFCIFIIYFCCSPVIVQPCQNRIKSHGLNWIVCMYLLSLFIK
jgi:hypothetical protein